MADETLNLSLRKVLKRVGVTSQQEIEAAVRAAAPAPGKLPVRAVVSIPALGLEHVIEDEIEVGGEA